MKMTITKKTGLLIFATLLFLSFLLINFSSSVIFGGRYFDFTSDKRLSLNQKTKDMLKEMTTPITIRLYVSSGIEKAYPRMWQYSKAIIKLLEQYRLHSKGKINYEVKYPEPYNNTAKEGQKIGGPPPGSPSVAAGRAPVRQARKKAVVPRRTRGFVDKPLYCG